MKSISEIAGDSKVFGIQDSLGLVSGYIRLPEAGTCSLVISKDMCGYDHVSVSPKHRYRIPTWEDMSILRDVCFEDDEEVYEIHPPKKECVNLKENCLHLWRPSNGKKLIDLLGE